MDNLIQDYKTILKELTNNCGHTKTNRQIRTPNLSDLELVSFNITAEYIYLF